MTLDPNAPEITTLSNEDILEVYSGRELKRITGQNLANSINTNIGNVVLPFVTVKQFGAVGNGIVDDTTSLQTAINYAISNNVELRFNPGTYKISSPLIINPNKNTFRMIGQVFNTIITTSTTMDSMLDINQMAYGEISGFRLICNSVSAIVDKMIYYYWDGQTGTRSVTRNTFKDIAVSGRFKTGFKIGKDGTGVQVDKSIYENITINGSYVEGDTTIYQVGIECGDAVGANNMLHTFTNLDIIGCKVGFLNSLCGNISIETGSFSLNETDFDIRSYSPFVINNVRSEDAGKFIKATVGGATFGEMLSVTNCVFNSPENAISLWANGTSNPNNYLMELSQGGNFIIDNFVIQGVPTGVVPKIRFTGAQRKQFASIRGLRVALDSTLSDPADLFQYDTKTSIDAKNIAKTTTSLGLVDTETFYSYEVINGIEQ